MEYLDLFALVMGKAVKLAPQYRDPIITAGVLYFAGLARGIGKSIKALNVNVAKVVDRVDSHELRISAIEASRKPGQ